MSQQLLIINVAGLGARCIGSETPHLSRFAELGSGVIPVQPPVPALTCTSQATLLTGTPPAEHGIVANGWYFRELAQVLNWQRSAHLMTGEPLWEAVRQVYGDARCANLFWRYASHGSCDVNVVERPTYWADGRKSPDIYTEPGTLRDELVDQLGPFPLFHFWGPAANIQSTRWIVDATLYLLEQQRFDLLLTYVPHLDYDHQRYGPDSEAGLRALRDMDGEVGRLLDGTLARGIRVAIVSDYAFENVSHPIPLNRVLREDGWITVQHAENGELLEPGASRAFAVCDQQTAHVYVNDATAIGRVRHLLEGVEGVARVLDRQQMRQVGLDHARSGELFVVAEQGCWFTFPYWLEATRAPDFAHCVAIHQKPGWDPSELFLRPGLKGKWHLAKRLLQKTLGFRAPFDVISGDMSLVRGAHGRVAESDAQRAVLLTSWPLSGVQRLEMHELKQLLVASLAEG